MDVQARSNPTPAKPPAHHCACPQLQVRLRQAAAQTIGDGYVNLRPHADGGSGAGTAFAKALELAPSPHTVRVALIRCLGCGWTHRLCQIHVQEGHKAEHAHAAARQATATWPPLRWLLRRSESSAVRASGRLGCGDLSCARLRWLAICCRARLRMLPPGAAASMGWRDRQLLQASDQSLMWSTEARILQKLYPGDVCKSEFACDKTRCCAV